LEKKPQNPNPKNPSELLFTSVPLYAKLMTLLAKVWNRAWDANGLYGDSGFQKCREHN